MSDFTIDKAQIVAVFCTDILYGIYLVSLYPCLRAIVWNRDRYSSNDSHSSFKRREDIHWPMLVVALLFFLILSLDVAFGLAQTLQAFVLYKGPGGAAENLADVSQWLNLVMSMAVFLPVGLNDAVLIYRCWIVYSRNISIILIPSLLWLGEVASACLLVWIQASVDTDSQSLVHIAKLQPAIIAFAVITIVQNLTVTSMIVYRIRRVDKVNSRYRLNLHPSRLQKVRRIVIESGLIVTTTAIICFITNAAGSNAFYVSTSAAIPICGIAFNLIIIRADRQSAAEYDLRSNHSPHISLDTRAGTNIDSQADLRPFEIVVVTERNQYDDNHVLDKAESTPDVPKSHSPF